MMTREFFLVFLWVSFIGLLALFFIHMVASLSDHESEKKNNVRNITGDLNFEVDGVDNAISLQ